jgi:hypothetical protein
MSETRSNDAVSPAKGAASAIAAFLGLSVQKIQQAGAIALGLLFRFGAAGAAASRSRRSARSRSVFARSAAAVASYSDVAFLASSARCSFAN